MIHPTIYRTRKIDAMDIKPGDTFYDSRDKCLYKVHSVMLEKSSNDVVIKTTQKNSRHDQLIKKNAYSKLTLQEFKY